MSASLEYRARWLLAWLLLAIGAQPSVAEDALDAWHPLNPARVADIRKAPPTTMGEVSFRRLSRAHELLGEADFEGALDELDRLGLAGLNPYEKAQVLQAYGFVYSQSGEQQKAFDAFEQCIALDALPTQAQQGIKYSLAAYYSGEERYAESNRMILRWFRLEAKPIADAYLLMAINYSEQGEIVAALPYVKRANALAEPPREPWKRLELALLFESKRYRDAIALLEEMISLWPGTVQYYEMISGLFVETQQDARALAALMVPWLDGRLTDEHLVLRLVRLNLFLEHPARGAAILERAIAHGHVQQSVENLELLLAAWTNARESEKAVRVIDVLAERAEDGKYYLEQALLLNERGEWQRVADAAGNALRKGGLERSADAWILLGIAMTELGRYDEAVEAFAGARRDGGEESQAASAWISYVRELAGS